MEGSFHWAGSVMACGLADLMASAIMSLVSTIAVFDQDGVVLFDGHRGVNAGGVVAMMSLGKER